MTSVWRSAFFGRHGSSSLMTDTPKFRLIQGAVLCDICRAAFEEVSNDAPAYEQEFYEEYAPTVACDSIAEVMLQVCRPAIVGRASV